VTTYGLKLKKKINEAKTASAANRAPDGSLRQFISEDVRQVVWQRDKGTCRGCGANNDLQFDHVIPVSMGGANIPDNLQILCGACDRQKGASL
jgi:5-methylcytosine-specific restriction endonuclease McrA